MEEVENASKGALECCHKVLNLLSHSQDEMQSKNLKAEIGEAVFKFRKVVNLLNTSLGHGRARIVKKSQSPSPPNIFLDSPMSTTESSSTKSLQLPQRNFLRNTAPETDSSARNSLQLPQKVFLESPTLEMDASAGKNPHLQLGAQTPTAHLHFLQQQQRFQLQQQMKFQADMMSRRSNSAINLKFDTSSCTPSMSSNRSFMSSLSMDGSVSVASLDGKAFHLIGTSQSSDRNPHQPPKRRCSGRGEDGSGKCGTNGRCHCSKRRLDFFAEFATFLCFLVRFELDWTSIGFYVKGNWESKDQSRCLLLVPS